MDTGAGELTIPLQTRAGQWLRNRPFLWTGILLALTLILSMAIGSITIPPRTILQILAEKVPGLVIQPSWPDAYSQILWKIRIPHALLVALTGAALAGSGAAYQGLFRNPLADPFLIGVASGAGLGAVLMLATWRNISSAGLYAVPLAAFAGATLTVFLVYWLARIGKALPVTTLILAGVAVSSFATSLTSFLMLQAKEELHRSLAWLLGGSTMTGWSPVLAVIPYVSLGLLALILCGHPLNVLQFGEEQAQQVGMNVERAKIVIILAASLTTAAAVSFSGLIGFIGLIVPHVIRLIWGPDYRRLLPLAILGGASFLLLADLLARTLLAPQVMPVGVVTALFGAPFFLWLLRRSKAQAYW